MYQNIWIARGKFNQNTVHLWDDEKGYFSFPFKKYVYMKDSTGPLQTIYGDRVKKTTSWTKFDMENGKIFESDIPLETRVLVDLYYDSDEVAKGHREVFFDIEVDTVSGLPDYKNPRNKITAISFYDKIADEYFVYLLDEYSKIQPVKDGNESIVPFLYEEELLNSFITKWEEMLPTIVTGWNIDYFDIPYLYGRLSKVLGKIRANKLSPVGNVYYNENRGRYFIGGISCLDYLSLYKKFTYVDLPSYSLDAVAKHEIKEGKVQFNGSLERLRDEDLHTFIEYNLTDTKLVVKIDNKMKLLELVKGICHKGHVSLEDVYYSSRWIEGAILSYLKSQNLVAPNKKEGNKELMDSGESYAGAYVKSPESGIYEWLYDLDFTSLYPTVIMSLNISPETKIGKILEWDSHEYLKDKSKRYEVSLLGSDGMMTGQDIEDTIKQNNLAVSSNGIIYRQDKRGVIPSILEIWYKDKAEYDKLMKEYGKKGDHEKAEYYSARRNIAKVMLNSVYGVLGLPVFRFYDVDNAEGVTVTGVNLIKFAQTMANAYYNKNIGGDEKDYCIYIDTDSLFIEAIPLVKAKYPTLDIKNNDMMTQKVLEICQEVQSYLNTSLNYFAKEFLNLDAHKFDMKQEIIARSGIWVAKKRYALWIINESGVSKDKIKPKGLDVVRSNFPEAFRVFMKQMIDDILKFVPKEEVDKKILEFQKTALSAPIEQIAIPTGVKGLRTYQIGKRERNKPFGNWTKGAPVHVKASLAYNEIIDYLQIGKKFSPIGSGEKIKWVYLRENPYGIEGLAFKGYDDPPEITDFIKKYIDRNKIWEHALEKKLLDFYSAIGWQLPSQSTKILNKFFTL